MPDLHPISCGCAACSGLRVTVAITRQRARPFLLQSIAALACAALAAFFA